MDWIRIKLSTRASAGIDYYPCFSTIYYYDPHWLPYTRFFSRDQIFTNATISKFSRFYFREWSSLVRWAYLSHKISRLNFHECHPTCEICENIIPRKKTCILYKIFLILQCFLSSNYNIGEVTSAALKERMTKFIFVGAKPINLQKNHMLVSFVLPMLTPLLNVTDKNSMKSTSSCLKGNT